MIVSAITGGLGNQLFQYAAARALSIRLASPIKLETTWYQHSPDRKYHLDLFRIHATVASTFEERYFALLKSRKVIKGFEMARNAGIPVGFTALVDKHQGFDERVLTVKGNVYMNGHWQSERYFCSISQLIRYELTLITEPDAVNRVMIEKMDSCEAVVLHVRRGDYVKNTSTNAYHGVCGLDYYEKAIDKLLLQVNVPHFFIFSDDPEWTSENLKLPYVSTYVTHNTGKQDYEDLRLMSRGKHFIVANSSFSWWGAWLSNNPTKNVIAPKQWFKSTAFSGKDLAPDAWTLI